MNILNYKGRLGRLRFILYTVVATVVVGVLQNMIGNLSAIVILGLMLLVAQYVFIAMRLHDLDRSSWEFLLVLIPIYNLYMLVILLAKKGTAGPNKYGPDPLGSASVAPNITTAQ